LLLRWRRGLFWRSNECPPIEERDGKAGAVTVGVRPITPDEAVGFLRIVPAFAGTPSWEPEPAAWHSGIGVAPAFDTPVSHDDLVKAASDLTDVDRTRAAFVDGRLVGTSQMLSLEVTVPGTGPVPMGGLTAVGVLPTHRRRGLLRAMMRSLLDDCRERGEALAALSAAEGGIYGRYGFGPATHQVQWELDNAQARPARPTETRGRIELVDAQAVALRWALADPRVTRYSDDLWVRLVDVPTALGMRTYQVEGSLVVDVVDDFCPWNQGCWRLEGGPDGAHCQRAAAGAAADLSLDAAALGSVYLGGTPLGPLAAAGLIAEHTSGALDRATAMLTQPRAPHNAIGF